MLTRAASLDDLPNEILLEIIRFVGEQTHIPRKYRVLYHLSLVNRRLRLFAFPLLERCVSFSSSRRFLRVVDYWERAKGDSVYKHESLVRSIRIGESSTSKVSTGGLHAWGNCLHESPFSNLTSFECLDSPPTPDVLAKLNESKSLKSLTLVWNGQHELYLHTFESLKSLRIYAEGPRIWSLPSPLVAPENLTKLVVHDSGFCRWSKELVTGRYVSFPSLRVLRLDECAAEPADIFEFIQIHSTLLEVSVSLCDDENTIRLEALKRLIEGTGTWKRGDCEGELIDGEPNVEVTSPSPELVHGDEVSLHYKGEFPDTHIQLDLFSFTRVPITENATSWRSWRGSLRPRYKATGLAFRIMDQGMWQMLGMKVAYIPDVLFLAKDHFPDLEELRVSSDTACWESSFVPFMYQISVGARELKRLRRLAISWTIPNEWTWDGSSPQPFTADDTFSRLDSVIPPTERCSDPTDSDHDSDDDDDWVGKSHSLDELRALYVDEYVDSLIDELRFIHGPDGVDTGDENLYVRTWEAQNEPCVAKAMRRIAEACPTLEQIDWYPTGMDSTSETTRWRWTIHRDNKGGVHLVSGNLTWKGCTRDPSAAMHILLGEELEYEEMVERRRW